MGWIVDIVEHLVHRSLHNVFHFTLKVGILVVLNLVEHGNGSSVEMSLGVELAVGQEVSEGSLLDEFVLFVNSVILELLFGVFEVIALGHLSGVSPLVGKLSELVVGVDVVEHREFWTNEVSEVTKLDVTKVQGK